ncbi:ethanolamine ammonia-lyase reactivating factor EutA [Escherichia coli]|uniref:ethanolamine ammonia-lyase reactivating factor EutA n=1 Tax=Escherichia coli TaxID=562 RepID=UPI002228475E|nr:ethanolamine ammonia-lyase reactivating factor EutA [Escherichia coli]MCW3350096.1 ethanolamine ammonia-lyase reactivating factor EutA [Escherichia coli]
MNTRQLLSVGIDIGTTTTQVIFSHLELVNRAAVSQVPRYEFIKREISWQSPVFFTPVDKQGGLKEAELKTLILEQYQAAGIAPESVDSGAIIITGESAKTRNARPAVMALSQSLGDFVVARAGPHLESVIAGHGAGAQTLSEQRLCRVLNIDIGGGTANYALFDAGKISGTACLNVGGRLMETDSQGRVVYAHKPGQMIVDEDADSENALVDFVARFPNPHPLLVVAGQDFGKALGMLLRPQLQQLPLAVIDEVIVRAGDYIDIGTPLFGGSVVPVTVKSLAFPS